ncbi:MAG: DMT family transporter [Hyphomicrobiales bacterium]|uniref:DMT family transporter n=1 Tax=Rhabdaerophilum calidifontis TaxID=2604328 RepID=UPI00123BB8D2|nr:DMT family transporter [Rhabdaerophilum calidifontis]MCA1998581.1 DMT family transporter [Hyphomicrobiales bacterium]
MSRLFASPYPLLGITMLLWGGNAIAARLAVGEISPMVLTAGRWLIVALIIALFLRREVVEALPVLRARWRFALAMGTLGYTVFNAMMYVSGHYTSAVNLTLLQGAIPIFTLIGAFLAYRTPIRALQLVGIAVTMLGVVMTATHGHPERILDLALNLGDVLMVAACALYAGYTVALKQRPAISGLAFFAGMAFAALIVSLPLVIIEIALGKAVWPGWAGLTILVYVAIGPSFLAQVFFMRAVELIGPGRAGLFANLVPVIGAILAVLILAEPFGWHHAVSMALVLGGIAIAERGRSA